MGSKPKAPKPTAAELELQRRQRDELNDLTRDTNEQLKAINRGRIGRRTLLGSGSELGIVDRARGGRASPGGGPPPRASRAAQRGGILGSGGVGRAATSRMPGRAVSR